MYAAREPAGYKDAVFLCPHKFIGGPGTPGVLVVRRELLTNRVPDVPGGGTVAYVNPTEHRYLADPVHREEGGTPAIVESIRAGLVFQLKEAVGLDDDPRARGALPAPRGRGAGRPTRPSRSSATSTPSGCRSSRSWSARPSGRYLHHNFVVALLNDLFGIQARGGCSCAGPYGHRLLGIDLERSHEFEREIAARLRGDQAGLGAGQLQLLHLRGGLRLPRRGGRAGRASTAGGCCRTTGSTRRPGCGGTARARSSRRCGWPT